MNPKFILVPILVLLVLSCKKDEPITPNPTPTEEEDEIIIQSYDTIITDLSTNDTIFPSDYLMCYPGSWWAYSDGNYYESQVWEQVDQYSLSTVDSTIYVTKKSHILPNHTYYKFVSDQTRIEPSGGVSHTYVRQLLSENLNEQFHSNYEQTGEGFDYSTRTTTLETTDLISTLHTSTGSYHDVLKIEYRSQLWFYHAGEGPLYSSDYYYARDIGLVRTVNFYANTDTIDLVNYHIEPY
jgi:hypothetical protein